MPALLRDIASRLELFVDRHLIDTLSGARLHLHPPTPANVALRHDAPWEGRYTIYSTVIRDGDLWRLYYRGWPDVGAHARAVTCCAEGHDGVTFTRPDYGLFDFNGSRHNNIILGASGGGEDYAAHNFCPMLDSRPGVPESERYKAIAGTYQSGVFAYASADGVRWRRMADTPVVTHPSFAFDSQNVPFWSEAEGRYLLYYRTFLKTSSAEKHGVRWISRRTSEDFLHWSEPVQMETPGAPIEHFYTNQTHPYFRAPHIYVALAARFWPNRRALSEAEGRTLDILPKYLNDVSDAVLMTTRAGTDRYERAFLESFIRPGPGLGNWVSRTNYPALGLLPTAPGAMSLYVTREYTLTTNYTQRYTLRTDGFASVRAGYGGGEMLTHPLRFTGSRLLLNCATSAAGALRVELQDDAGRPLPGYTLADCPEILGDHIERAVLWSGGESVAPLAGRPVRLRFVMKDADLFSLRFA
jgi:hypothetical protein